MRGPESSSFPITILPQIEQGLDLHSLEEYKEIKVELNRIMDPAGIWSREFSEWMDKNIRLLSIIGKGMDAIGGWRKRKSSPLKKEELEHYGGLTLKFLEETTDLPSEVETWLYDLDPDLLSQIGKLLDYTGRAGVAYVIPFKE